MMNRFLSLLILLIPMHLSAETSSFHSFKKTTLDRKQIDFSRYKNKVLLVVNIASKCGYTPQLKGLQNLYDKYKNKNFEVIAFPSNDFNQEPLEGIKIGDFCKKNYGVDFTIFQKISVRGPDADPVYKFLSTSSKNGDVKWNFEKFIVNGSGQVIARFDSDTKPESESVTQKIEKAVNLQASKP